jgi:phage/plasmid-like protein (TIGR03299 family)
MPANVESMFSVRQMPWHREGIVTGEYPGSWDEARKLAGMDWQPTTEAVYKLDGVDDTGNPRYEAIPGWQNITRSDTGATLWINRESYTVIDHSEMGVIIEAVLSLANVKWETAGVLDDGRAVWCLAMLDEPIVLPGDDSVTLPYMAMTNRHGIPGACTLRGTAVRIVCGNTFRAAELEGDSTGATFSFVHKKNWRDRIDEARQAVTGVRREMADYVQLARELLDIRISPRERELFVTEFIPMPPTGLVTDRVVRNVETARTALRDILASPTTEAVADTGYGLVQAAGEYLDHVRRARSWETKLGRTLMRPEPLKAKALTLVRELA